MDSRIASKCKIRTIVAIRLDRAVHLQHDLGVVLGVVATRFIADHMLDRFTRTSWSPSQAASGSAPRPDIRIDLKAKMRGMWR